MYYVYAIISGFNGNIYVGLTRNIDRRLKEHNSGKTRSTKKGIPWKFFYSEEYPTRIKAREREIKLKSGSGKEFLREILKCACSSVG